MSSGLLVLAALTTLGLSAVLIDFLIGHRTLAYLKAMPPAASGPRVSVVVAARNEARGIFLTSATYARVRPAYLIGYPFAALLFAYIIWRSALIATFTGTVIWRGTAYPLADMRANRI